MTESTRRRIRMNRAVEMLNKGDTFTSDVDDPKIQSLLGAGYAEVVSEEVPTVASANSVVEPTEDVELPEPGGDGESAD